MALRTIIPSLAAQTAQVHIGKPLFLSAYKDEYRKNPAAALLRICRDAHQAVHQLVLHITEKHKLETAEQYLSVSRNNNTTEKIAGWKIISAEKLLREQNVCRHINKTVTTEASAIKQKAVDYFSMLNRTGLTDKTVKTGNHFAAWKTILLLIGFPFYLAGLLFNGLPVLIGRSIADKKVYRNDFYTWIFVACTAVCYFLWMLILIGIVIFIQLSYAPLLLFVMVSTGIFAYLYKGWLNESSQQIKWNRLPTAKRQELMTMRSLVQLND